VGGSGGGDGGSKIEEDSDLPTKPCQNAACKKILKMDDMFCVECGTQQTD